MHVLILECLIGQGKIDINQGKVREFCVSGNPV